MPARWRWILVEPGAAAATDGRPRGAWRALPRRLSTMPDSACGANSPTLDGPRQRAMIDLNCGTLVELCHAVLPGDDRTRIGRDPQRRLDRRLPARPRHGDLFRDQGVRPVVHRSAARGSRKRTGVRVTALCPGPTRTEFGDVAGFTGNGAFDKMSARSEDVVAIGLKALDQGTRGGDPRAGQQGRRARPSPAPALAAAQGDGVDQILGERAGGLA